MMNERKNRQVSFPVSLRGQDNIGKADSGEGNQYRPLEPEGLAHQEGQIVSRPQSSFITSNCLALPASLSEVTLSRDAVLFLAQSAVHSCDAPILDDGYLVQKQITYPHEANLMYGCDNGRKPAVEGWWATITCQNGTWSHKPQCIDEKDCIPPDIPNAKYKKSPKGWYDNNQSIYITCDKEYESKNRDATAICSNGTWTSVPVCEKSIETCGEPPKIPHAVIIHQEYQELFAADSEVQYECEDGYTVEGGGTKDNITCIFGNWTEGSACRARPGPVNGGSAGGGTGGRPTTSTGSGTQHTVEERGTRLGTRDGGVTPGSGVPPAGGGLSAVSGSNEKDSSPSFTKVNHCGAYPVVPNGDVVKDDPMFLKYQCNSFYKRVGPDIVRCHSEGSWSQLPICQEAYCVIDLAQYPVDGVKLTGLEYVNEGETKYIQCIWDVFSSRVKCISRRLFYTQCCHHDDHQRGVCS